MQANDRFVGTSAAQVTVRPASVVYLIRFGDREGFERSIANACTQWGGIGRPIIPLDESLRSHPIVEEQLRQLQPDVYIDYADLDDGQRLAWERSWGGSVHNQFFGQWDKLGANAAVAVEPTPLRSRTLFLPKSRASLMERAALGVLSESQRAVWAPTGMAISERETLAELLAGQLDAPSAVRLTGTAVEAYKTKAWNAPVIVFTFARPSLSKTIYFWNMRAAGAASGLPAVWLPAGAWREDAVVDRVRRLVLSRLLQTSPDLLLVADAGVDTEAAGRMLGFQKATAADPPRRIDPGFVRDISVHPLTYSDTIPSQAFLLRRSWVGVQVTTPITLTRPSTSLRLENPIQFYRGDGRIKVEIDEEHFRWPRSPSTVRLVHQNAEWSRDGLALTFAPEPSYTLDLRIADPAEVASHFLADKGSTWERSDKGKYTDSLRDSLPSAGDDLPIDDASLRVIRSLVSLSSKKAKRSLRRIARNHEEPLVEDILTRLPGLAPRWMTAGEIASVHGQLGNGLHVHLIKEVLGRLVRAGLVYRAFRFDCPVCGIRSHIPFDRSGDAVRCEGCRTTHTLLGPKGDEPRLAYALNALLDRVMDQDCIGHLLVQVWAERNRGVLWSVPGAILRPHGGAGPSREVDLFGISRSAVVISEVKDRAAAYIPNEVDKAVRGAVQAGAGMLLVAALDSWSDALKARVARRSKGFSGEVVFLGAADLLDGSA